ncbi:hypothetical protein [Streptomyces sp. NPDC012888]|uniref:hypothetical protein n=1 Tax=Streptomyces sp. NPDC012888 TaxID=3364855 RepID=UPI0036836205
MSPAGEDQQLLDPVSVLNAKTTLVQLLARAGVRTGDAEELIGLVEAGALAVAHAQVAGSGTPAPREDGADYASGWRDGASAVRDELGELAERTLRDAFGAGAAEGAPGDVRPVGRMELERAQVAVLPLYLAVSQVSDLDPEVSKPVLTAVLGTMGARERAAYAGRLTRFASSHRDRLERLYGGHGPGSPIAVHGRYTLLHSPTSVAVLERLITTPAELREEWDAAELPPMWLDGLLNAWAASA